MAAYDKLQECPRCGAERAADGFLYDLQHCGACGWDHLRDGLSGELTRRCHACHGAGRISVTGTHRQTWDLLCRRGETWPAALAREAGCSPNAMANRLAWLAEHGLAKVRRDGRRMLYRVGRKMTDGR